MGATLSADTNTSIEEVVSNSINEFITNNSSACEGSSGAVATFRMSDVNCEGGIELGDINVSADSEVVTQCIQANISVNELEKYVDNNLKNSLENETKNMIGISATLNKNTQVSKDIQNVLNKIKTSNILTCLTRNLSTAEAIQEKMKSGGKCIAGNVNVNARAFTQLECIQKNDEVRSAITKLSSTIDSSIKNKKSGTGLMIGLIILGVIMFIFFMVYVYKKSQMGDYESYYGPPGGYGPPRGYGPRGPYPQPYY